MDCCEFREKYSEFADGLLAPAIEAAAHAHLEGCAPCRRLDAAFRAGIGALRDLPPVDLSRAFRDRLRWRLRTELASRFPAMYGLSGAVGALLLVATVGFISFDLVEAHRYYRQTHPAAEAALAPPAAPLVTAAASLTPDTLDQTALHPLQPLLIVADTHAVVLAHAVRMDIPAVWGGQ